MSGSIEKVFDAAPEDRIRWVVRQRVTSVQGSWLVEVENNSSERMARQVFGRLTVEHPAEYFELVKVLAVESCVAFTAFR